MERETQTTLGTDAPSKSDSCGGQTVLCASLIGAATLACLAVLGFVSGAFNSTVHDGYAGTHSAAGQAESAGDLLDELKLFKGWGHGGAAAHKPEVVIVLSGEQHGYLQPCGCTEPQFGGLTRRYNLIQQLRQRGWPVVAADLGDINQKPGPQTILKYTKAMKALDFMGYTAVNFGEFESSLPLIQAMASYSLNEPTPKVVNASLLDRQPGGTFNGTVFDLAMADKHPGPKVGIFGVTGPSVEAKIHTKDPSVQISKKTPDIIVTCLNQLKANKAELVVLLYQGSIKEAAACANFCADAAKKNANLPLLNVILCISEASEPPAIPLMVGETMIVDVGQKGRYVGVVGAFRRNGPTPFKLDYQLVPMEPKLATPAGKEKDNKVMELMEEYTKELRDGNFLVNFRQVNHPVQVALPNATYVGSAACQTCHAAAFKVWQNSKHAHAYQTLVNAKNPSLRQFDGECVVCHTVGFGYKSGFENDAKTKFLTDVGCESCHGPCSEHVAKPRNVAFHKEINQFKWPGPGQPNEVQKHQRELRIDQFCQKCHDLDNDNNFQFNLKWPQIIHMNPPVVQPAAAKKLQPN